jgi:hypothetical protein
MDRKTLILIIFAVIIMIGGGFYYIYDKTEISFNSDPDRLSAAQINSIKPMGIKTTQPSDRLSQYLQKAITTKSANWGDLVPLQPKVFTEGQSRESVEAMLFKADFAPTTLDNFSWRQRYDFGSGTDLYRIKFKDKGCTVQNSVMVQFDDNDRLISAQGLQDELGCL